MTDVVWSRQGTTPDEVQAALRDLLARQHAENSDYVPARVLNMIVFVDRQWSGEIANRLRGVGRYPGTDRVPAGTLASQHPGALVVATPARRPPKSSASISRLSAAR